MKLRTLGRIIKWFEEYQPNLTDKEWTELYEKLIDEEQEETRKALREKELLEFLDWVWDTLWVYIWHLYFWNWDILELDIDFTPIYQQINFNWEDFIDDLLNEIADSNFSKSYELQGEWEKIGKVIKWPNFKKPDIQKIIDKYKIEWK